MLGDLIALFALYVLVFRFIPAAIKEDRFDRMHREYEAKHAAALTEFSAFLPNDQEVLK